MKQRSRWTFQVNRPLPSLLMARPSENPKTGSPVMKLVAKPGLGGVARAVNGTRLAARASGTADHAAALVGEILAGVGDDLVDEVLGDPHRLPEVLLVEILDLVDVLRVDP